ncbi:MAG: DNA translocase FtsK, partial [Helicobacter sp.]|nr:DNA translocase FtsK [Helicobacter sp.]
NHRAWQQNAQSYLGAWQSPTSPAVPQTRPSQTPFVVPAGSIVPAPEPTHAPAISPQPQNFAPAQNLAPAAPMPAQNLAPTSSSIPPQNVGHIAPEAPTVYVASPLALQNPESRARFMLPPLAFLQSPTSEHFEIDETEIDRKVNNLLGKLRLFKIEGDIVGIHTGPIVTTFEYRPAPHIKVSRILNLSDDLAMALQAKTLRIEAPVPGKDVVGIEIPNSQSETILLRDVLQSEAFVRSLSPLTLALGKDIIGRPFVTDLRRLPHLLIAGTTGSGKSVGINAMILSLLYRNTPRELKFIMIDPKMLEFSVYNDIPHLLTPVITESKKAISALAATVGEMEKRYAAMSALQAKNIETYNQKVGRDAALPYIVVVIDELADLMMTGGKEVEFHIARLAQMARASGIHLIIATQRPSVDVVTGSIKANLPARISYKVGAKVDSKVILDTFGAETLLGKGDMLFNQPDGSGIVRLHAPWSSEDEITRIVEFIKSQGEPEYDEEFLKGSEPSARSSTFEGDDLYEQAKQVILNDRKTSTSYLQRRLGIGYNKAANIIEELEREGFLSAPNSKGAREIL